MINKIYYKANIYIFIYSMQRVELVSQLASPGSVKDLLIGLSFCVSMSTNVTVSDFSPNCKSDYGIENCQASDKPLLLQA